MAQQFGPSNFSQGELGELIVSKIDECGKLYFFICLDLFGHDSI
jgi:hypothetical protein